MDYEETGMIEHRRYRAVKQKTYGELFPQRFVANMKDGAAEDMMIAMLAMSFLDMPESRWSKA